MLGELQYSFIGASKLGQTHGIERRTHQDTTNQICRPRGDEILNLSPSKSAIKQSYNQDLKKENL